MVDTHIIVENNARFDKERHAGLVCVFAGATSGIGRATLERIATMINSSTIYVLGRSPERHASWLDRLRQSAPSNKTIFIETQVSLLSSIDAACEQIKSAEKKVDCLCMSMGGMPFQGAVFTEEGLETCFAISYYSRLRLVTNLLALLHRSKDPRVLSILNGTREKKIYDQDIGLEKNWGLTAVVNHTTLLTSLTFDYLATNDKQITFIHCTPGFVVTGTERTRFPSKSHGLIWWAFLSVVQIVSGWIILCIGMKLEESGERQAFYLTSDMYRPGSWRTNKRNEIVPDNTVLQEYKERGWQEKAWEHTVHVWDKALASRTTHPGP